MKKAKGTFWMRSSIVLLALLFGVLVYWSVGFLLHDIGLIHQPDRVTFFKEHASAPLEEELLVLQTQLRELEHQHQLITQQRGFIKDSSASLKIVVDNLFQLKSQDQQLITKEQFGQVLAALDKVIAIQEKFQTTADDYIRITNEKFALQKKIDRVTAQIKEHQTAIRALFSEKMRKHRIRTALIKMAFLIPFVFLCTFLLMKKRASMYRMIYNAAAAAIYLKTTFVIHENFPSRYFKYILTLALLGLIAWGFGWLIRRLVRPKLDILIKQYRQAYERFLCPVCEYPIRTGPRKYLYWTRRTVHKMVVNGLTGSSDSSDEPYTCPACGTALFEKCETCGGMAHSLLPNCQHCGATKMITGENY